jgi:multicomponent Na+:H+ antiporter subunit G
MSMNEVMSVALVMVGAFFFLAGTAGLLRFPDTISRLHALTKADNLGLGFIVAGLAVTSPSFMIALKLVLIWLLVLLSGAGVCYLMARAVLQHEEGGRERG